MTRTGTDGEGASADGELLRAGLRHAFGGAGPQSTSDDGGDDVGARSGSQWVDDRYAIRGELGRGGMGVVYRAFDADLGREVALKVLRHGALANHAALHRFSDEARVCAQLQHRGIVPMYDTGVGADGFPYFTMRIVEGRTLRDVLASSSSRPDLAWIAEVLEQMCDAVGYAHARGVVHRDLKPSNVMIGAFGEVFVMDWGLAKVIGGTEPETAHGSPEVKSGRADHATLATSAGAVVGTVGYMSPEQARGEVASLDARTDVFAVGAILFEVLVGARPHAGASDPLDASRRGEAVGLWAALDAVEHPVELVGLARSCLQPRPEDRPKDAGAVAQAIGSWRRSQLERARVAELDAATARAALPHARRVRRLSVVLVSVVVLVAAGVVWIQADARSRRAAIDLRVEEILDETARLRLAAASAQPPALPSWLSAHAAAERAVASARSGGASTPVMRRAVDLLAALERDVDVFRRSAIEEDAARTDGARIDELLQVRYPHITHAETARRLADFFAGVGISIPITDVEGSSDLIRRSRIASSLLLALDQWIFSLWRAPAQRDTSRVLAKVADRADGDPFRTRVRNACVSRNAAELASLAADPATLDLPGPILANTAVVLTEVSGPQVGLAFLKRVRERLPGDFFVNNQLAWTLDQIKPVDVAALNAAAAAALASAPKSALARANYAHVLHRMGALDEALRHAEVAVAARPDLEFVHRVLGSILNARGEYALAEAQYRAALDCDRRSPLTHFFVAEALINQKRFAEAEPLLVEAVRLAPSDAETRYWLGFVEYQLDRFADAEAHLLVVLADQPRHVAALRALGATMRASSRHREAVLWLERARVLSGGDAGTSAWLDERIRDSRAIADAAEDASDETLGSRADSRRTLAAWIELAESHAARKHFVRESELWRRAFATQPELFDDLIAVRRAARAAAAAGGGRSDDGRDLDAATRRAWRDEVRHWIGRFVESARRRLEDPRADRAAMRAAVSDLSSDRVALRDAGGVDPVAPDEARLDLALWEAVTALESAIRE